jgi:hypothetical protein
MGHFTTPNSIWGVGSPAFHGPTWVLSWKTSRNRGSNQPEIWVVTNYSSKHGEILWDSGRWY